MPGRGFQAIGLVRRLRLHIRSWAPHRMVVAIVLGIAAASFGLPLILPPLRLADESFSDLMIGHFSPPQPQHRGVAMVAIGEDSFVAMACRSPVARAFLADLIERLRVAKVRASGIDILLSIGPRGQALGVTYQRPQTERYNYPESYLRGRIIGMLGGRAAEEVVYGTRTTGAESDIEQATALARNMVTRWGMSDTLGMVQLAPRDNPYLRGPGGAFALDKAVSEETARLVDAEVHRIIHECHEEAKRRIVENRAALDALVKALTERETLDEQEILEATGITPPPAPENRPLVS
jgi:hypothetical protein